MKPTGAARLVSSPAGCWRLGPGSAHVQLSSGRRATPLPPPPTSPLFPIASVHIATQFSRRPAGCLLPFPDVIQRAPGNASRFSFAETGVEGTGRRVMITPRARGKGGNRDATIVHTMLRPAPFPSPIHSQK